MSLRPLLERFEKLSANDARAVALITIENLYDAARQSDVSDSDIETFFESAIGDYEERAEGGAK